MKRRIAMVFAAVLLAALFAKGQLLQSPQAISSPGFSAYSSQAGIFSFITNPAALAKRKRFGAGIYGERSYGLAELGNYMAAIILPTTTGNFGLKIFYNGFSDYNKMQAGLAYAHSLGTKAAAGAQFNYNSIRIAGYGNASTLTVTAGGMIQVTSRLLASFHINNPVGGKLGNNRDEKLPAIYSMGFGYGLSDKLLFNWAIQKEEDKPVTVDAGIQYYIIPQLAADIGISSATASVLIGFTLVMKNFTMAILSRRHPQLGISPALLLIFDGKAKEE